MTATRIFEYHQKVVEPPYSGLAQANAYYNPANNSFTVNYRPNDPKFNKGSHDVYTACHEMKHQDNYQSGMYAYALSPEQAYKANMHDEISANIAQLISLRDEYLKTGDISVFDNEPRFKFYKEAIINKEINPRSNKKEDFDKDMSLIANGTRNMWIKAFGSRDAYIKQNAANGAYNCEKNGIHAQYYNQNYERTKKIAYGNIGGVDFNKYMEGDVEIPPKGRQLLDENLNKLTVSGRKAFYEANADIICGDYFERDDDVIIKAAKRGPIQNNPINHVNSNPPKYPPNAHIERMQIPDMRTNIIKQPIRDQMLQDREAATRVIQILRNSRHTQTNRHTFSYTQNGSRVTVTISGGNRLNSPNRTNRPNKPNNPNRVAIAYRKQQKSH